MDRVVIQSRVGADGVVRLEVPVGAAEAERTVQVTIDPVLPAVSREEWQRFVRSTAGSIANPSFVRHPQGDYESREPLP